ncbi:unnamed protein product [Rhizopus stolonifer]
MIDLPRDIFEEILTYIEAEDLLVLSLVSHQFYHLTRHESIWKKKCFKEFVISPDISSRHTSWKRLYFSLRNPTIYIWNSRCILYSQWISSIPIDSFVAKDIVNVDANCAFLYALDRSGRLWNQNHRRKDFKTMINTQFQSFAIREYFCVGLDKTGDVWLWNDQVCKKIHYNEFGDDAIQITCTYAVSDLDSHSDYICFVLTNEGRVYFLREILYHDETKGVYFDMQLEDTIIQIVGLTYNHILVLTQSGRVLLMNVREFQAFKENPDNFTIDLKHFGGSSKRSIAGGFRRFVVYTDDGEVLFGDIEAKADTIPSPKDYSIHKISFGPDYYGIITKKGELIVGNSNNEDDEDDAWSTDIEYVPELRGKYLIDVSFSETKNVALVIDLK